MDISELDDDDELLVQEEPNDELNSFYTEDNSNEDLLDSDSEDALSLFLRGNGILDMNKIKFEDENGEIVERSWKDLDNQELLNILRSYTLPSDADNLDLEELDFINHIRSKGLSPSLFYNIMQDSYENLLAEATRPIQAPIYSSDLLSDDDLFVLDLKTRIPDITDEELEMSLSNAKENEDLYNRLIAGIRNEYLRLESEQRELEEAIALLELQDYYNQYANSVLNSISNFTNVGDLDINMNEDEMNNLADFMLGQDAQGNNHFYKALSNPETSVRLAWFALHGEHILNDISNYYTNEIKRAEQEGFKRGKASVKSASQVVYKPNTSKNNKVYKSIDDLDD